MSLQLLDLAAEAVTEFHCSGHGPANSHDAFTVVFDRPKATTYMVVTREPFTAARGKHFHRKWGAFRPDPTVGQVDPELVVLEPSPSCRVADDDPEPYLCVCPVPVRGPLGECAGCHRLVVS